MRNLAVKVPTDLWLEFKARVGVCYQADCDALALGSALGVDCARGRELGLRRCLGSRKGHGEASQGSGLPRRIGGCEPLKLGSTAAALNTVRNA
jgi:hypothetical protein